MPETAPTLLPHQDQRSFNQEAFSPENTTLRSRLTRRIAGSIACLSIMTGIGVSNAESAHADTTLVYEVANTEGGVFSRNSPNLADTPRIVGQGAYDGDTVELICGVTNGEGVGPYNNNTWHYVKNQTRPEQPNFWINDHNVKSPNVADTLAPGEQNCGNTQEPQSLQQAPKIMQYPATPIKKSDCDSNIAGSTMHSTGEAYNNGEWNRDAALAAQPSQEYVCVTAQLSNPDTMNQRQFVNTVNGRAPYLQPPGCGAANLIEIWGDGFYKTTNCTQGQTWEINKWLKAGTYICAASSSARDFEAFGNNTEAANKAVESGRIKLGEHDPHRSIECVKVEG